MSNQSTISRFLPGIISVIIKFEALLAGLFFILVITPTVWAAIYYVDATGGNNSNNGISQATPWKTIAKVNSSSFIAGDTILFKKGETWREQLTVPSSGGAGKPITFGAYGSGANPIISGADLISTWTLYSGNIWRTPLSISPFQIFFDSVKGTLATSISDCNSTNKWFWASNILYVYSTSDPGTSYTSPGIEASARQYCLLISSKDYITVTDLTLKFAGAIKKWSVNLFVNNSDYFVGDRLESSYAVGDGIQIYGGSTYGLVSNSVSHHNGISTSESNGIGIFNPGTDNITIIGCTTYLNQGDGIVAHGDDITTHDGPDSITIQNNISYQNGEQGIEIYEATNCLVQGNICYGNGLVQAENGEGIKIASEEAKRNRGNIVLGNTCYNNITNGISAYKDDGFIIAYNVCYGNLKYGISAVDYSGGTIANNTIYNSKQTGICLQIGGTINVIIKNNIITSSGWGVGIRAYSNAIGKYTSNNNCITDANFGRENTTDYNLSNWKLVTSQDSNSLISSPLFVNSATPDFHLKSTSSCIDAGADVGLTKDIVGTIIPKGAGVDIGAYESILPIAAPGNMRIKTN